MSDNTLDRVAALRISGRAGGGALLVNLLAGLSADLTVLPSDAARLGCALADLLTVALSAVDQRAAPPETMRKALLIAARDYVRRHLDDHELNAASVAAAHHVSTRTLNRVFESDGDTVSAFISRCRFDRCVRDLADPALRHQAIQDIVTRWGFLSRSHFNRRFRKLIGTTPGEYRNTALRRPPLDTLA